MSANVIKITERIRQLDYEKRKVLFSKLDNSGVKIMSLPIVAVSERAQGPLSYAQQRLWFLWQLDPHSATYNMPMVLRLSGDLEIKSLQASFNSLVDRHEILRTHFCMENDFPIQKVDQEADVFIDQVDLQLKDSASIDAVIKTEINLPFDLERGPLLRVKLLRVNPHECILLLTQHHIISDGESMALMIKELIHYYRSYTQKSISSKLTPPLKPLPIQYLDFSAWQRQVMDGGERDRQLAYWLEHLKGIQPLLELPLDRDRTPERSPLGETVDLELDLAFLDNVNRFAKNNTCSVFVVVLASITLLLRRYSGQTDICIGVPSANRNRLEIEGLIGFFVNTLVLRTQVDDAQDTLSLLKQVKDNVRQAQRHQDLPFEELVNVLAPERSVSHSPIFQAVCNHQTATEGSAESNIELPGLTLEFMDGDTSTTHFDLSISTLEHKQGITASFSYTTDIFDKKTIERLADYWVALLQAMTQSPHAPLSELEMLGAQSYQELVHKWNPNRPDKSADLSLQQAIEFQVATDGDAVALIFEHQPISYAALNSAANRLANKLIERDVGPDVLVGVLANRSVDMIIAVLAIIKAGGAYVPLDPSYPSERLAYMVEDSALKLLLTHDSLNDRLVLTKGINKIYLDEDCSSYSDENPPCQVHAKNIAYMVFTSGTTGRPKGVSIDYGALSRHVEVYSNRLGLNSNDHVLQYATYNFDTFGEQLFPTLCCGASVVLRGEALWDNDTFYRNLIQYGISVANLTPTMWYQLFKDCAAKGIRDYGRLRIMIVGGEAMPLGGLNLWQGLGLSHVALWNFYGPTEVTAASSSFCCNRYFNSNEPFPTRMPIGEVLDGRYIYLVDASFTPVPLGVKGELLIGGELLARGYHCRSALTAERFVADPFDPIGGSRLYRTGDLARFRDDGVLEYLGRIDDQVKIRGFRVELGEIESQLHAADEIHEAAVLVQKNGDSQYLLAHLVPKDQAICAASESEQGAFKAVIKSRLEASLPAHMVPLYFVLLARMPLTPNGKLDRKALPSIDINKFKKAYKNPETPLEKQLAKIWQDVLGLELVGLDDNFFELGGDSIISLQIVSRARQVNIQFTPKDVFQYQTLSALAQVASIAEDHVVAEQGVINGTVLPNPIQSWFLNADIPQRHHWNQSLLLRFHQTIDVEILRQSIEKLLLHHDALRLHFTEQEEGTWEASFLAIENLAREVLWQHDVNDEIALSAIANTAQRSLDLKTGPLIRIVLFTLPTGDQRLLLAIHHLIIDGVSWRILLEDLQVVYQQLEGHKPAILPLKTSSLKDWSEQLQRYAMSAELKHEQAYWQHVVSGGGEELPRDNPTGSEQSKYAKSVSSKLDKKLTAQLIKQSPSAYRTQINDLLLTALARVICHWTNKLSMLVALEGHGREELFADTLTDTDLTRTVGWFTSLFPVCLTPSDAIGSSIKNIKEQLRAIPNKGLGYGVLRYLSDGLTRTQMAALPEARITFNYLGQFDNSFDENKGALFSPAEEDGGASQSDESPMGNWLEINGQVYAGELTLNWGFSGDIYQSDTVQALADAYTKELTELISHCVDDNNQGLTPSDFPFTPLTQAQIDTLPVAISAIDNIYPLTPTQKTMLDFSRNHQDQCYYINQTRANLHNLNPVAFRKAWQETLDQHESLRAAFYWDELDEAIRVIKHSAELPFHLHDWTHLTQSDQGNKEIAHKLAQLGDDILREGFDLNLAPLLRVDLVKISETVFHLIYTNHHLLLDGWSASRMMGEILQRYMGLPVSPNKGVYRDYLTELSNRSSLETKSFWLKHLSEINKPTMLSEILYKHHKLSDLYTNPENSKNNLYNFGVHDSHMTEAETHQLETFAKSHNVTINTLIQTAWALLLYRYSAQNTVVFGATVSGRPVDVYAIEQQLGLFINTIPVAITIDETQNVGDWLRHVQAVNASLREYDHVDLSDIQDWLKLKGELFDSVIVFENYPVAEALTGEMNTDLIFEGLQDIEFSHYNLRLIVAHNERIGINATYSQACFSHEVIEIIIKELWGILRSFSAKTVDDLKAVFLN